MDGTLTFYFVLKVDYEEQNLQIHCEIGSFMKWQVMMYGTLSSEYIFRCVLDKCGDFEHCFSIHQIVCGSQMQDVMLQCTTSDEFHVEGFRV
jgi:hypothetical protein